MPAYVKPTVTPAWGETNTTVADMIQPTDPEIQAGWPTSAVPPSRQRFNWILHYCANAVRYFMQRGLSDYDATETYATGARIIGDDGKTYSSLVDANVGNTPSTSPTKWQRWGFTVADLLNFAFQNPTANTQATADNSTKVATTAYVNTRMQFGFSVSLGANGYIKLPALLGGLIVQWFSGPVQAPGSQPQFSVNFPIPFPNACLFVLPGTKIAAYSTYAEVFYQLISFDLNSCNMVRQTQENDNTASNAICLAIGW